MLGLIVVISLSIRLPFVSNGRDTTISMQTLSQSGKVTADTVMGISRKFSGFDLCPCGKKSLGLTKGFSLKRLKSRHALDIGSDMNYTWMR